MKMPKNNQEAKSKQELIGKWESAIEAAEFYGKGKEEKLISYMEDFVSDLNQLDEPEVLSQEWIRENKEMYLINDTSENAVPDYKLQSLLVPKQGLPVIPKHVAVYLEKAKKEIDLLRVFEIANGLDELEIWRKEYNWIRLYHLDFARAWLDGYEVEEEQKYYVLLPEIVDNWRYVSLAPSHWGVTVRYTDTLDDVHEFTEKEIKDYDERYWPFAEEVEK